MFADYVTYFRYLCEKHPDLLHAEQVGERVFEVISVDDALGDFRSGAKSKDFIVRLILPAGRAGGDVSSGYMLLTGGFLVAKYHSDRRDGKEAMLTALDDSLRIAQDFMARIMSDSAAGVMPFRYSSSTLDAMQPGIQPRTAVGDVLYSGWLITFQFSLPITTCLGAASAPAWTDGGEFTP